MRKIDGREAEIIDIGKRFSTYWTFAVKHGFPDAAARSDRDDERKPLKNGDIVTLLVSGEHESIYEGDTLWIVEAENGERHIFNEKGLRILDENITVLPDESLGGVQREYREVKRKAAVGERIKITYLNHEYGAETAVIDSIDYEGDPSWSDGGQSYYVKPDWYVVLEPTDILRIDGPNGPERFRMVDRKAAVGDRVIIVDADPQTEEPYANGAILSVEQRGLCPDDFYSACGRYINANEYRVLEPVDATPAPLSSRSSAEQAAENIATLASRVTELEAQVAELAEAMRKMGVADDIKPLRSRTDALESGKPTPQQLRDEIVERAKADVEALLNEEHACVPCIRTVSTAVYYPSDDRVEFVVNRYKRKVSAVIRYEHYREVWAKGNAVCAPSEVFNVHIGKAIALRRALGLEVPAEYLNAPAPTEVRVGDVVKTYGSLRFRVTHKTSAGIVTEQLRGGYAIILDDSRDQTEEVSDNANAA